MKISVLLCEDHALFREGLRALFKDRSELEVVGDASDGRAAVEEAIRLRPQVVILDIELPGLNGVEALRRMRRAAPGTRVLVLTLYDDEELVARCLDEGASGYVLKDGPSSELVHAVQAVSRGERYLSPRARARVSEHPRGGRTLTPYDALTDREREVVKLLADGLSVKGIAARLGLSAKTVDAHKYQLMRKLDLHDRAALVKYAIRRKLIRLPVLEPTDVPSRPRKPPSLPLAPRGLAGWPAIAEPPGTLHSGPPSSPARDAGRKVRPASS